MYAPDRFLNAGTAAATAVISAGVIGVSLRQLSARGLRRAGPGGGAPA